ncbi:bifunctional DNA primase/polymerase [Lacipirellula parvula]|uniref:DNA primase/polymerase bifunctional N-terminal domain-containing protein n=1 Tax=Lacipirellula parvula TaxID=2650471 RepID=A0A5K7XNJ0_9BACT|nr:bifunctional DNA primase/polymerase [Lacipirellula parvula]BBO34729.1 hypothetical protein PLANPX_4341 [Lacipirellula parvula]
MQEATINGHDVLDDLLEEGERLIARGWRIIPCNGKIPCDYRGEPAKGWNKLPATVERLRIGLKAASDPGIGLVMGADSKKIDMEVDDDSEIKARDHLWRDVERPVTLAFQSKRGRHDIYAFDPRLASIPFEVLEYSDGDGNKFKIRLGTNDGGAQSVIPPTAPRAWIEGLGPDDVDAALLPDVVVLRLLACAEAKKPKQTRSRPTGVGIRHDALDAVRKSTTNMEDGGDGSKRLFTAACRSVELNCSDIEAVATINAYAAERPFPKGFTDAEILQRIRDAEGVVQRGEALAIRNYEEVEIEEEGETKVIKVPSPIGDVVAAAKFVTGNWPRRSGGTLFVDDSHGLAFLEKNPTPALFGFLRSRCNNVDWYSSGRFCTQSEFASEFTRTATTYDSIENTPHEPARPATYYRCDVPPAGDGRYLRKFLDLFRPETTIDRDLIQAAAMSLLWGGPFGATPAFAVTSDHGRGVGKTSMVQLLTRIVGGSIDVSANEDGDKLTTRLLTPAARTKRAALWDNIKSMKLSSEKIEALITAPEISGRQLYVGEGTRPNNLVWFLTLNAPSMSTDLAQRSIPIKLVRGDNSGPWLENANRFVDDNRQRLIGDIIGALRAEPFPLRTFGRWAAWEQAIVSRLPEPGEAQQVIAERQAAINTDLDESEIVEEFFCDQLAKLGYDVQQESIRIPSAVAARWYGWAINEPVRSTVASKRMHQLSAEGQMKRLAPEPGRSHGRCYVWTGPAANVFYANIANDLLHRISANRADTQDG